VRIVIGGGITGLTVASQLEDTVVLEQQSSVGGLYSIEEVGGLTLTIIPPVVSSIKRLAEILPDLKLEEWRPIIKKTKEEHLKMKVCPFCDELPTWLDVKEGYLVHNLPEALLELGSKVKIVRGYPLRVREGKLFTNRGILEFSEIINTGSREELNRLIGVEEDLKKIGCLLAVIVSRGGINKWDVLLHGSAGISFSHVFRREIDEKHDVYHVYAFTRGGKHLDADRILGDLKRASVLTKEDVVTMRVRYIRECILAGEKEKNRPNFLRECGRLGLWDNLSLEEAVESALRC
jgi:hypothetical protein